MTKIILDKEQIYEIVQANKFKVNESKFISRCIDGRYEDSRALAPLAIAGADLGEIALLKATGNAYGFEVDMKKTYEILAELVGGIKNFQMHTDSHGDPNVVASGCGHLKQIKTDPAPYKLTKEDVFTLAEIAEEAKKSGAQEIALQGEHIEGAVLQIKGDGYSVKPRYFLETEKGTQEVETFVFHATLVNDRHKELAKKLLEKGAVKLFNGLDAEYLYEVISEMTENHLLETAKRLAKGLPIYLVDFAEDGTFELTDMGEV